ncbi:hypothetical protein [Specibacter cremeus]|uniref:PH-like domain-containing protein n=1 Tax=Specibacter cremeus TaxID=1629051 RepID=UPI000F77CB94|nr:hypothetical protein [Specibacter cremeus]
MGDKTAPVIVAIALVVVIFGLIGWGWRGRLKRQAGVAPLPDVPVALGEPLLTVPGQYVVTTMAGDWLDRLAVHGLGVRTNAELTVHPEGVLVARTGAADLFIGRDTLTEITTTAGLAGKFVEKDGLVVIGWRLGGRPVDTGFRTRAAEDKRPLVTALENLLPAERTGGDDPKGKNNNE